MVACFSTPTRALRAALLAGIGIAAASPGVRADEVLGVGVEARGFRLHGADETMRHYCSRDAEGHLWLQLPGGARFELVTSTQDPSIPNPGDGAFHPFEEEEVRAALGAVQYPLGPISADVFILPFPRRGGLQSAAGPELILLSPGVRPLSAGQQHAELVHELGHVVQYALMPDLDTARWDDYRRIRGIEDRTIYSASSVHADRPHEIFAEDFRALFGGSLARYSGTIENPRIKPPWEVHGLDRFILELTGIWPTASRLAAYPNPTRGPLRFSRAGGWPAPLDLFDAAGRHVATLEPVLVPGGIEWNWGGFEASGRSPRNAVLFARVRGDAHASARVAVVH